LIFVRSADPKVVQNSNGVFFRFFSNYYANIGQLGSGVQIKMEDSKKKLVNKQNVDRKWSETLSPEKLKRIRKANASRQAERRRNETPEQAAERKKRDVLYKVNSPSSLILLVNHNIHFQANRRARRALETPEDKAARLAKNAHYQTMYRRNETPEKTAQRRQRESLYKMRRRQKESLDQKNARLAANAKCQSIRRSRDPFESPCMHCGSSDSPTVDINEVRFSDNDQVFTLGDCFSMITGIKTEPEATAICQMCQDQLIMSYKFKRQFQHLQPQKQEADLEIKRESDGPTFQTIILQGFQPDPPKAVLPSSFPPVIKLLPPMIRETSEASPEPLQNQCQVCLKTFTNQQGVQTHMDTIHAATPKKYACSHCGYETIHKRYIRIHVMRHVSGFVCVVCNKAFRYHIFIHFFEQPFIKEKLTFIASWVYYNRKNCFQEW
jgi:hypothetical protein